MIRFSWFVPCLGAGLLAVPAFAQEGAPINPLLQDSNNPLAFYRNPASEAPAPADEPTADTPAADAPSAEQRASKPPVASLADVKSAKSGRRPGAPMQILTTDLDRAIARHADANGVPEALVRRVIKRESGFRSALVSRGNYGLMQIKLGTARGLGYDGSAAGLLDPETNLTYAVRYLAGALQVAGGNPDRAVHLYQRGYYYEAKRQRIREAASR